MWLRAIISLNHILFLYSSLSLLRFRSGRCHIGVYTFHHTYAYINVFIYGIDFPKINKSTKRSPFVCCLRKRMCTVIYTPQMHTHCGKPTLSNLWGDATAERILVDSLFVRCGFSIELQNPYWTGDQGKMMEAFIISILTEC